MLKNLHLRCKNRLLSERINQLFQTFPKMTWKKTVWQEVLTFQLTWWANVWADKVLWAIRQQWPDQVTKTKECQLWSKPNVQQASMAKECQQSQSKTGQLKHRE
jgi:hypothetical protein